MEEELVILIILVLSIVTVFTLGLTKMILSHLKWRHEQKHGVREESGVGLSELRALFQQTVEEANAPLEARLDDLTLQLAQLTGAEVPLDTDEWEEDVLQEKTVGRRTQA